VLSCIAFLAVSVAVLGALRPVARSHLRQPPALRTGTAALVGRTATVVERIDNGGDAGCVRLEGELWRARAFDEDDVIEAGARVQVIEIRGATAVVAQ
jgi:membrane protein implicated in regulation of membrane protease activity